MTDPNDSNVDHHTTSGIKSDYLRGVNDSRDVVLPPQMVDALRRIDLATSKRAKRERAWRIAGRVRDVTFFSTLAIVASLLTAQVIDRRFPVDLKQELDVTQLHPGERLKLNVHVLARYRACEVKATYTVYDGEGGFHNTTTGWLPPAQPHDGDPLDVTRYITVGRDAVPGDGLLRIVREARCPYNIIQRVWPLTDTPQPLPFIILKHPIPEE